MSYSELIKNFDGIRDYMRDFYVCGFRTRTGYHRKSARSYDNERRRIESWLGDYMSFRRDREGRHVFLSANSRTIPCNPLYKAYKSKSFTVNDVMFHFLILDVLADGSSLTAAKILEQITDRFSRMPETAWFPDESTLRKKLKEYTLLGLLCREKKGGKILYRRNDVPLDTASWADALRFASETDPVGVIGSFLMDQWPQERPPVPLRFKHHYLLNAFDQEILWQLMEARRQNRKVKLTVCSSPPEMTDTTAGSAHTVYPLRFFCSTQSGRRYLLGYEYGARHLTMFRLDRIRQVHLLETEKNPEAPGLRAKNITEHIWGVSIGNGKTDRLDHVEMVIRTKPHESFVAERLEREKRCGTVRKVDDHTLFFCADVCDAMEMLPWIRTFTGRIASFSCSNPAVTQRFRDDLKAMQEMYLQPETSG